MTLFLVRKLFCKTKSIKEKTKRWVGLTIIYKIFWICLNNIKSKWKIKDMSKWLNKYFLAMSHCHLLISKAPLCHACLFDTLCVKLLRKQISCLLASVFVNIRGGKVIYKVPRNGSIPIKQDNAFKRLQHILKQDYAVMCLPGFLRDCFQDMGQYQLVILFDLKAWEDGINFPAAFVLFTVILSCISWTMLCIYMAHRLALPC